MRYFGLVALAVAALLQAQNRTSAVSGEVRDETGGALPGCDIAVRNLETGVVRQGVSDQDGRFRVGLLELGRYEIQTTHTGFSPEVAGPLELTLDREAVVMPVLQVAGGASSVIVEDRVLSVDAAAATLSGLVGEQEIRELPLNGRDYLQLASLEPGVNVARAQTRTSNTGFGVQLSISGSRPVQNGFRLDGISVSDHTGSTPGSINGLNLGVDGIREFSVLNSTYSAQYGRAAGGVINAVTRSGTNEYHGGAYYFFRNDNLDARNYFDPDQPPEFRRNQFGGSLGGPVVSNRIFFFSNAEFLRESRGNTTINTTLSDAARQGLLAGRTVTVDPAIARLLALYPRANGTVLGDTALFSFPNQSVAGESYVTGRVDWLANQNNRLFFRYTGDLADRTAQTTFAIGDQYNNTHTQSAVAELQTVLSPGLINSARLGFSRSVTTFNLTQAIDPAADDPTLVFVPGAKSAGLVDVPGLSQFPGGSEGLDAEFDAFTSFQGYEELSWAAGKHTVSGGVSLERTRFNQDSRSTQNGEFFFASIADFLTNVPQRLRAQIPGSNTTRGYRQWIAAGYVQDAWKLTRSLRLDFGLRYEWTSVPEEVNGRLANLDELTSPVMRTSGPLFNNPSNLNLAPRAGFAWNLPGRTNTILRGGYGIYDDLLLSQYLLISGVRNPPFYLRGDANSLQPGDFPSLAFERLISSPTLDLRAERIPYDLQQPYVQQWNLNVQQPIGRNAVLSAAYVGSHGLHLTAIVEDANLAVPVTLPGGLLYFPTKGKRLNPAFGMIRNRTFDGQSFYQSAQLAFQLREWKSLQLQSAYTFSKSIDDDSVTFAHSEADNSIGIPVNNPRFNRGLSNFDVRQHFAVTGQWQAPTKAGGIERIWSNWRIGTIVTLATGLPFSATLSYDAARTLTGRPDRLGGQRPDLVPGASTDPVTGDPNRWFDPAAFQRPRDGFLGNLGRNTMTGPGFFQTDIFVARQFSVPGAGERLKLDFRVEAYNATNHTNFDLPAPARTQVFSRTSTPEDVGRITSAEPSREIQIGVKLLF